MDKDRTIWVPMPDKRGTPETIVRRIPMFFSVFGELAKQRNKLLMRGIYNREVGYPTRGVPKG